ncbi:NAD(P)-binding protein [Auricularia subglabra TFB-10046 SS5]|nr:NAD(P)-binding protein [Auricularia subglabra TFB-10046 SS5]
MSVSIKTVVVHGATGKQGGSAVRILSAAGFKIRAAVRDASAPKALELAAIPNVELVVINIDDVKTLVKAYTGADAVFAVTVPGQHELTQGKNMADAAKTAGVRHFVWSTLESPKKKTGGEFVISFYDDKDAVSDYIASIGLPATYLYTAIFFENLVQWPGFSRYIPEEDTIEITCGSIAHTDRKLPMTRIEVDLGEAVKTILTHSAAFLGQHVIVAPHWLTLEEQAAIVAKVSGRKARVSAPVVFPAHMQEVDRMWHYCGSRRYGLYHQKPYPDPLLEKYGFQGASVESFVREVLLSHYKLA